ncbi:MAG: electron transfer flavoprotein-ubiquinone oxidoreductase, partial [Spirochaetota bacterium]|nr:electron transfer flavoprotein-ubiquinone oxidoreductase [Spirochaetota bacterium]
NNGIPQTPGYNLFSKVTVLGEGPKGTLTKQIIGKYNLDNSKNVPTYELGCKEIWELPEGRVEKGKVVHSLGFPLNKSKPGGGFIYHLSNNRLALGMVTYLSSKDPFLDTHRELQNWKNHIYINSLLKGGKCIYYGAKAIPSGGYYSIPKLTANGVMILGDSANLLNSKRLKGIHLAMKSGVLAAEAIFDGLKKDDLSEKQLSNYEYKFSDSWAKKELYKVRNFSQSMVKGFPFPAIFYVGFQTITYGNGILGRMKGESNHKSTQSIEQFYGKKVNPPENVKSDSNLIIDKLSDVFLSNTTHNEKQVSHITINNPSICKEKCYSQFGSPCTNYCPANVYEVVKTEEGGINIKVNFANCVHCKAADMKCPFDNITWMPPVGGDGPKYTIL